MRPFPLLASLVVCVVLAGAAHSAAADEAYARAVSVATLVETSTDAAGQPIAYPHGGTPEITGVLVELPVGQDTGWHTHPSPCVAYVLQGRVSVALADGRRREYQAGDAFAEVVNLKHCGYNIGPVPVRILLFAIGEKNVAISRRAN